MAMFKKLIIYLLYQMLNARIWSSNLDYGAVRQYVEGKIRHAPPVRQTIVIFKSMIGLWVILTA